MELSLAEMNNGIDLFLYTVALAFDCDLWNMQ